MGLVKGVVGKVYYQVINFVGRLFVNPIGNGTANSLFLVAVDEVLPLFFHYLHLFLGNSTPNNVGPAKRVATNLLNNLHYLFLVNYTAIG